MAIITPDLVEWLVSDPQVSSSWRSMAKYLALSNYIPSLEVSRRTRKTDSHRMKELLIIWRSLRPDTYTVDILLKMLETLGMKGMYEWIHLMTKDRLSPNSLPSYVFTRLNNSQHSLLSEDRSEWRTLHNDSPGTHYYNTSIHTTPTHSRPHSAMSEDFSMNHSRSSIMNYSRSSISPRRDLRSPSLRLTSTPIKQQRGDHIKTELTSGGSGGVFQTLYCPQTVKRRHPTPTKLSYRHSSYNPHLTRDTVTEDLSTIEESPKIELKQFDEAFAKYKARETPSNRIETEKYFDNLLVFLSEVTKGLD